MDQQGASPKEIQYHYDINDDFYKLFLDDTRSYSCALWESNTKNLHEAQINKILYHLNNLSLEKNSQVLDVGCGWGELLKIGIEKYKINNAVGLTLSKNQYEFIHKNYRNINIHLESWSEHKSKKPYDGIISIGAFEHFSRPNEDKKNKILRYSDFFSFCHSSLNENAKLSLQTIAYNNMLPEDASSFIQNEIFPGSELPFYDEIIEASAPYFKLISLDEDPLHYAKTCETWLRNLKKNRTPAYKLVGKETTQKFEHYLRLSAIGFTTGRITLYRILFEKNDFSIL